MLTRNLSLTLLLAVLTGAAAIPSALAQENPQEMVALMNDYLNLADKVVDTAQQREKAIFLAVEGIFEVYEQRRDAPGAVRHLTRILDQHSDDRVVRNLVRFKLRDIYKETGDMDKALEQLDLIVAENTR